MRKGREPRVAQESHPRDHNGMASGNSSAAGLLRCIGTQIGTCRAPRQCVRLPAGTGGDPSEQTGQIPMGESGERALQAPDESHGLEKLAHFRGAQQALSLCRQGEVTA